MSLTRAHLVVHGHVQGVFYRASTARQAAVCGVKGWVRNLPDGNVEVMAEGETAAVDALVAWCRVGPPNAYVTDVDVAYLPARGEFTGFIVRY